MKKIVMGMAALACAASMFAADVSAKVVLSGNLLTATDSKITALNDITDAAANYQPHMALSVSNDKAGAGFKVVGSAGKAINLWLKPTDFLKLSFNENALELAGDKYHGYYATNVGKVSEGFGAGVTFGDFGANLNFKPGFYSQSYDADPVIGEMGVKFSFGNGTIGNIAALADFDSNFKKIKLAAGYSNTFGPVGAVLNAGVELADAAFVKAMIDPSVGGSFSGLGFAVEAPVTINANNTVAVGTNASVSYTVGAIGLKLYFEDADFFASTFDSKIGLDVTGNVGGAGWKVAPSYITAKTTFAIDYEVSMAF